MVSTSFETSLGYVVKWKPAWASLKKEGRVKTTALGRNLCSRGILVCFWEEGLLQKNEASPALFLCRTQPLLMLYP